jgi:hypothetical protein
MMNNLCNRKSWLLFGLFIVFMVGGGGIASAKDLTGRPKQFNLACQLRGRIVSDPHPDYTGTYPANVKRWTLPAKIVVDLSSMKYCFIGECKTRGLDSIASVSRNKIVFDKTPGDEMVLRRHDRLLRMTRVDGSRVEVTQGYCRVRKFSGFPAASPSVP